jgi:hypothetical protein
MRDSKPLLPLLSLCLFIGCASNDNRPAAPAQSAPTGSTSPASVTDRWVGKWRGPEGTFLQIAGGGGEYTITIRNLDGPRTFDGFRSEDRIAFVRDGAAESIRAGSGAATGMKWLADKSDCLVVKPGEGYCRG